MKAMVVKSNKQIVNGVELTNAKAVELSKLAEVAAIIDLTETMRGYRTVYQDGVVRQYDPVENVIIGAAQPNRGRVGWTS